LFAGQAQSVGLDGVDLLLGEDRAKRIVSKAVTHAAIDADKQRTLAQSEFLAARLFLYLNSGDQEHAWKTAVETLEAAYSGT